MGLRAAQAGLATVVRADSRWLCATIAVMAGGPRRLNPAERRLRSAFLRGAELDLEGACVAIRADVVAGLLTRVVDRAAHPRAALRLRNAMIVGRLDIRQADIAVPVLLTGLTFTDVVDLTDARTAGVALIGCVLPGLYARLLEVRGDLDLTRCTVTGPVDVRDARISGSFTLDGATLGDSGTEEHALAAARITVAGDLSARDGFTAQAEFGSPRRP